MSRTGSAPPTGRDSSKKGRLLSRKWALRSEKKWTPQTFNLPLSLPLSLSVNHDRWGGEAAFYWPRLTGFLVLAIKCLTHYLSAPFLCGWLTKLRNAALNFNYFIVRGATAVTQSNTTETTEKQKIKWKPALQTDVQPVFIFCFKGRHFSVFTAQLLNKTCLLLPAKIKLWLHQLL